MLISILFLLVGLIVLIFGGEFLVKGAVALAKAVNISPLVIGMTIVAFGTSAPELIVSITSALNDNAGIAVGNVIGSNIANIALVLGATVLILPIPIDKQTKFVDFPVMLIATGMFYYIACDGEIVFLEGLILFLALIGYLSYMATRSIALRKKVKNEEATNVESSPYELDDYKEEPFWKSITFLLVGFIGLYFGAEWFVDGAIGIAEFLLAENPEKDVIIGVTIVALGTSAPELVASTVAAYKGETDLSIGNLLGSNIFNIFAVIGITGIVSPMEVTENAINFDMWWMIGIAFFMGISIFIGNKINRWEGVIMLGTYFTYMGVILLRVRGVL
ncbi:MAG: calcium/sodium antiporter [Crocinitomicaceae bacterium]